MIAETKTCQNCKLEFKIEPEDFKFYEKIKVPPPTWCPECRMVRRMAFRNERALYKRNCDLCKKEIISMYPASSTFPVYCHNCWWSDKWDPFSYRQEYNFSKPFFEQFLSLLQQVPRINFLQRNAINSPYSNLTFETRNAYLATSVTDSEDIFYSQSIDKCRNVFDCWNLYSSELCYENLFSSKNYSSSYLLFSRNCLDSRFLFDSVNLKDCVLSTNLRNKQFVLRNQGYTKEEFQRKMSEINFGSFVEHQKLLEEFSEIKKTSLRKHANNIKAANSSGDNLTDVNNCSHCFDTYDVENSAYLFRVLSSKDCMDVCFVPNSELIYEYISGGKNCYNLHLSVAAFEGVNDSEYTDYCSGSSSLFACIGLRNKSYCILNKQYTKEEYEELVPKIIEHMNQMPYTDKKGRIYRYGEFFPPELSPFSYNETIAQEYFPLTKEEAIEKGYSWKDPEPRNYQITLKSEDISDHIKDVKDDILNQIIGCAHASSPSTSRSTLRVSDSMSSGQTVPVCNEQCTEAFRIIPQELSFLRKQNLPIPRLCPNCRHYQRIKQRNPLKLWHRKCMCGMKTAYQNTIKHDHEGRCPNEFETTYAPERPEIVYCEGCYLREVV